MNQPRYEVVEDQREFDTLVDAIKRSGSKVVVRGMETREVCDIVIKVEPHATIALTKSKKFADMRLSHIKHKVEFDLNQCIELLSYDPTSRRARILEADYHPFNIACIQSVQFLVRNGNVDVKLFLRASDIKDVLPLDIYATRGLQKMVLEGINQRPKQRITDLHCGSLTAFISSAHVYVDQKRK